MTLGDIGAIPTERVDFHSGGTRCAAWMTLPRGPGPHPAVVLVHGLGATHDMMLAQSRRAPKAIARHYDSDHFAIYHPPLVRRVLADQTAFLLEHLDVRG